MPVEVICIHSQACHCDKSQPSFTHDQELVKMLAALSLAPLSQLLQVHRMEQNSALHM